jgi:hypothetical protein
MYELASTQRHEFRNKYNPNPHITYVLNNAGGHRQHNVHSLSSTSWNECTRRVVSYIADTFSSKSKQSDTPRGIRNAELCKIQKREISH